MSNSLPERADFEHLREEAKSLLRALNALESDAVSVSRDLDSALVPQDAKLADAQRLIARKYGFPSWNQLKEAVEVPQLMAKFVRLVEGRDAKGLEELLDREKAVRDRLDNPLFSFDQPAIVATGDPAIAKVLLRFGADPNARSRWWAGGFGALDFANEAKAQVLLDGGANFDIWSAAVHDKVEVMRELLQGNRQLANAPGGDGRPPLSFAKSLEAVELLLEFGADPNQRDVDHESTALQYQINRPEIARRLIEAGGVPDVFILTNLDDAEVLAAYLVANPEAAQHRKGLPPFTTVKSDGGHIYTWEFGANSPLLLALERGRERARAVLERYADPGQLLVAACYSQDDRRMEELLLADPDLARNLPPDLSRAIADAAGAGMRDVVGLMLRAGFSPLATGMSDGTPLHTACWYGHLDVVEILLDKVLLDTLDATHGSPPLGWTLHGAQNCRRPGADYPAIAERLIQAGADVHASANKFGTRMIEIAGNREDVKQVLRKHGAK